MALLQCFVPPLTKPYVHRHCRCSRFPAPPVSPLRLATCPPVNDPPDVALLPVDDLTLNARVFHWPENIEGVFDLSHSRLRHRRAAAEEALGTRVEAFTERSVERAGGTAMGGEVMSGEDRFGCGRGWRSSGSDGLSR